MDSSHGTILEAKITSKPMRYESEMIAPIKACIAGLGENSIIVEELGVGYGVADVVAALPCVHGVQRRLQLQQTTTLLCRGEVQVLRILRQRREATFNLLAKLTGISESRLRYEILSFLLSENYVQKTAEDTFQLLGEYRPVAQEIWAVEAKMKNWFQGMCQAKRYQHFAHKTYLAIAALYRNRVHDAILREHNVGLITVAHNDTKIIFHPRRRKPRSEELFLMTNEQIWDRIRETA